MSDEIELLAPEPATLTVEARAAVALKSSDTELHLIAMAAKNAGIVAILDKPGREQAHGAAMELKRTRVAIENTSKAARDDATKFSKAVIAEEKRLVAIIEPEESRLLALRDDWDAAQAAIKAEAERVERARIMAINERIAGLRSYVNLALECRTSERIQGLLDKLIATWLAYDYEEDFAEFGEEAQATYDNTHAAVTSVFNQKLAVETENARIKADQQAAADKLKAEREAHEAEAKKLADERAAFEAERAAMAAERAAAAAKVEAERLAQEAAAQAEADSKALADYHAAITTPVEAVPVAEPEAPPVSTELFDGVMELSGQLMSIAMEPTPPNAEALIGVIATHFKVSDELAAEWLDSADFTPYY